MSLRLNYKADARKQCYKVSLDKVEARRKRGENMIKIRKFKRQETLLKKRREAHNTQPSSGYDQTTSLDEKLQSLPATAFALASDDIPTKEAAAIHLRKMLTEINPPIDAVIESGVVPLLVDILRREDMPQLQFEAARALTNIASGTSEHTKVVIDYGALPLFVDLLTSVNDSVREQVVWGLGNIAGDCPAYRDLVLAHGALRKVLAQFNNKTLRISMIKIITWTLSNICSGKPQPQLDQVKYALPALEWLLHIQNDEVLADACWALLYISDGPSENVQAVIDAGICPKLVELLSHSSSLVLIPALRTVGNIVTGDAVQTQVVIDNKALDSLLHLLTDKQTKKTIIKDTCWTISNVTAGTTEQVQAVINANIFPPLLSLLENAEFDIKKDAAWAVSNATSAASDEQIRYLAIQGCIKPLCDLLTCPDPTTITVCLDGLENILRAGETEKNAGLKDVNLYAGLIEDAGGLDNIEALQIHENKDVYEKSVTILANYFVKEDDDHVLTMSDITQTVSVFSTDQQQEVSHSGFNFK